MSGVDALRPTTALHMTCRLLPVAGLWCLLSIIPAPLPLAPPRRCWEETQVKIQCCTEGRWGVHPESSVSRQLVGVGGMEEQLLLHSFAYPTPVFAPPHPHTEPGPQTHRYDTRMPEASARNVD